MKSPLIKVLDLCNPPDMVYPGTELVPNYSRKYLHEAVCLEGHVEVNVYFRNYSVIFYLLM